MGSNSKDRNLKTLSRFYEAGRDSEFLDDDAYTEAVEEMESDGYHTFNELYRHRYVLFVGMARAYYVALRDQVGATPEQLKETVWCSKLHADGTMFEDSFIVGMTLNVGQVSYHLPMREWDRVSKILPVISRAPEWDGHTPADVLDRLERWVYENATSTANP